MCSCDSVSKGGLQGEGDWIQNLAGRERVEGEGSNKQGKEGPEAPGCACPPGGAGTRGAGAGRGPGGGGGVQPAGCCCEAVPFLKGMGAGLGSAAGE